MARATDEELKARIRELRTLADEESLREARRLEGTLAMRAMYLRLWSDLKRLKHMCEPDAGPES
jgi:hypothetical protein